MVYGFVSAEINWSRQTRGEIEGLIATTGLGDQMLTLGFWDA